MRKYRLQITGQDTSGSFEFLFCDYKRESQQCIGSIPVADDTNMIYDRLALFFGGENIIVECEDHNIKSGPKYWDVTLPGFIWVDERHGGYALTGMNSPSLQIIFLGRVDGSTT